MQCYFHLEEYDDALEYALAAGDYFNVDEKSEFVETLIGTRKRCRRVAFDMCLTRCATLQRVA